MLLGLTNKAREAITRKKAAVTQWKMGPNQESLKAHNIWERSCRKEVGQVEKESEEHTARDIKPFPTPSLHAGASLPQGQAVFLLADSSGYYLAVIWQKKFCNTSCLFVILEF